MAFAPTIITEHLIDSISVPWQAAPSDVQKAAQSAGQAVTAHMDALSALEDAQIGVPTAKAEWDAAGRAAMREDQPLPSRDVLDRAAFTLANSEQDAHLAERKLAAARGVLASLLSDQQIRDAWRANLAKQVTADQARLSKAATDLASVCAQVATDVAFTQFLGTWPNLLSPPPVTTPDPAGALRRLAQAKVWTKPIPPGEATFQQPTSPDVRPAVWIVNDSGGIHDVAADKAEELLDRPGWRLATSAEAEQASRRQHGR